MARNRLNPYQNGPPVPPISAGPVPYVGSPALPLPPLGAKTNQPPPLQRITVQPPPVVSLQPMPSLGGMGGGGASDAFKMRLMQQMMAPPVDPNQDLKDAIRSKQIHDLLYPPKDPREAAQDALDAENYARYLRGEPPIQVANAQAASENAQAAKDKAAKAAQDAFDKAQTDEEKAQAAAVAKQLNPASHYLASRYGLSRYSDDNGLNLTADDITHLDQLGSAAADYAITTSTGNPSNYYWNAIDMELQNRRPQGPQNSEVYPSGHLSGVGQGHSNTEDLTYFPVTEQPNANRLSGLGQGYSNQEDTSYFSTARPPSNHLSGLGDDYSALPLPPGGALPEQTQGPPNLRTQATNALSGGAVAGGIVAGAAALIGRRLGIDPIKAGLVAAGLVGAGDVAVEQGWISPAVKAAESGFSAAQRALQSQVVGALNPTPTPPGTTTYPSDLSPLIDAVSGAFAKTDPSQPFLQRLDNALTIASSPFEEAKQSLTAPLGKIPYVGAPIQGVANTAIDLGTNPVMWDPALWGPAALRGAGALGAANYARSALMGETPEQQTRAVEEGANIGLMAGPAVEGAIKLIRGFITKPAILGAPEAAVAPAETAAVPPTGRPLEAIQSDLQQANDEWAQFRQANPTMPVAEQVQHPAAQRIAALADERDAALNPVAVPAEAPVAPDAVTPAAEAVAPEVVPPTSPSATAPLLHPVTGQDMTTTDFMRNAETKAALDELHAAGDEAKAAKKGPQIKKAAKRMQAAAEAFVGPNDPAGAQRIIDAEMGRAATPAVVPPVVEAPAAVPSAMDDLLAEQAARTPVAEVVSPPVEPVIPPLEEAAPAIQPEAASVAAETTVAPEAVVPQEPAAIPEPVKSQGHQAFIGDHEYFTGVNGDLFRAPITDSLDTFGYRSGARFASTSANTPMAIKAARINAGEIPLESTGTPLNPSPVTNEAPEVAHANAIAADLTQARSELSAWKAQNPQANDFELTQTPEFHKVRTLEAEQNANRVVGQNISTATTERPASVTAQLPSVLAGAKPRYNFGSKNFIPEFDSDIDKGLYIVAQTKASKQDAQYLAWLREQLPGKSDAELRAMGQIVRNAVKDQARGAKSGAPLTIPSVMQEGTQLAGGTPGLPGLNPNTGAQGVAALGLVTPQQPGESDDQYQTRLRLSAGLMAVGFLKPGDSLVGDYGSGKPFYSQLARTVATKIQKTGTVEQALAALRGGGAKAAELAWTGIDDFLKSMKPGTKITRAELQDYLKTHQVDVHEVVRGEPDLRELEAANETALTNLREGTQQLVAQHTRDSNNWPPEAYTELQRLNDEAKNAREALANASSSPGRQPKYEGHVTPGGQNYRELVLTTPGKISPYDAYRQELAQKYGYPSASEIPNLTDAENSKLDQLRHISEQQPYQSNHWPEEVNPLGHVRFDERTDAQGNRVLHITEIQSDWSQAQRSEGVARPPDPQAGIRLEEVRSQKRAMLDQELQGRMGPYGDREDAASRALAQNPTYQGLLREEALLQEAVVGAVSAPPPTPFAENFNDLAVKRMLYWAVDHGFGSITWDPGAVHAQRWGTERLSWESTASRLARQEAEQVKQLRDSGGSSEALRQLEERQRLDREENPPSGFVLLAEPQIGGHAAGIDLQGEAAARGLIQQGSPVIVNSLDDIKNHLQDSGFYQNGAPGAREVAENRTIADKLWAKMQGSDAGIFTPRKTGLETAYDTLFPQVFNKIGKVFGGKAGEGAVQVGGREPMVQGIPPARLPGENLAEYRDRTQPPLVSGVHQFDIPPAMKESVLSEGMPLYSGVHPTVMAQGIKQLASGAGAVGKWALKNPGKATLAGLAGMTVIGALTRARVEHDTGKPYGEFSSDPRINYVATFGGLGIQPRDFMEGSGIYADHVALPALEWALETIDVAPYGIAKILGSDPAKTKGGVFNTDHTLAWVGDVFGGPSDPVSNLYDGLKKRSQEYKIDQPLASFVFSLPFDPLNWLGWGVAEKSAPNIAKSLFETSPAGIAARIAKLENPNFGKVPRLNSGNPLEDRFFAMTAGPRALWNWSGQLSRASRATQLADEHARLAVSLAGSPTVRASSFLEDVAAKMVVGKASGDEMKIANILAKRPPVDESAVRQLAEDLGHRLDQNDPIDPDLIDEISKRVQSKHAWTPDDVSWLKDQFDSLRPLENAMQSNVAAWHQNLGGAPATMADFEQLRRLYHIPPNVTFSTGMGAGRPEILKGTLETINDFLKTRPMTRLDGSPNLLRPSEVSFIGKMLGKKGWGLTQDTRINAWAAKYGLPDLGPAIERSKGLSMQDFSGVVASAVRRNFPPDESALRTWLEHHSFTMKMLNTGERISTSLEPWQEHLFTPLKLSFLTSLGFPVHIARTLSMRNPEVSLQAARGVLNVGRGIGGVVKEAVQTGFGTSAYRAARNLPQGPGFVAPVLVRGVKSELGNLAFWHNADLISEAYLGDYGRSFLYGGHSSMLGLPADTNPVSKGIWPIGRWMGPLTLGDDLKTEAKLRNINLSRERAALVTPGSMTVEQAAQVPVNPINALMSAGADVVHNANIGSVFGVTSHAVAQMEQGFRMGFVAWQHPIVYKQVLATLDDSARAAQAALDRIAVRPAGLTDDAWKRVRSLFELKGSSGKLNQLVDTALDGTIDRNAFAQAAFQEPDLPEIAKSELWGVLNRSTPAELTTIFAKGGYADQMLEKVLQQTYSGRVSEALNQTVAELTPKLETLRSQIKQVETAQKVYRKAGESSPQLLNQHNGLIVQRDNLITESWKSIESVLNDQMQVHHRLWEWAYDAKRYVPEGQKDQFFASIQQMRQKLIKDGQTEASEAMQMWRQQVLRQGIPIPKEIIASYDNIFEHIQGAFAASDHATQEAWAFTRSHKGPGSQAEVSAKWHEVWQQNDATWNNYRAFRDGEQEKIFARLKQYYTAKKGLSVADKAEATQEIMPRVIPPVPEDARIKAQAALERIRGVADNFVQHPPMPDDQVQIIRQAAARIDEAAAKLPQDQLDAIKHAHLATANLVMQEGNKRFLNYLTRSNFDQLMTKTLFPFWQYDRHGGSFYTWMLSHIPGSAESYAREIMDTKDSTQGTGYFPGDFGPFGNQISPNRGLWDYRVKSITNFMLQNRPDGLKAEFQQAFQRVLTEGFLGGHVSPALSFPTEAALGSNISEMSLPPLVAMAQDVGSEITGRPFQTDQFARRAIADALVAMNVDPYHPTPEQYEAAVRQAAQQDMAGNVMPMFTEVLPERIAQRADFAKALTAYGYPPEVQKQWLQMHPGQGPWGMLNKEQGAKLMDDHPGWKYLFEASTVSLPPEELQKRIETSDLFENLHQITQSRLDDQAKIDAQVLGSKDKPATITPTQWMDQRGSRMQFYLGQKDQFTKNPQWQVIQTALDDPEKIKLLQPEDQAKVEYYLLQNDLIKKNTDQLGKINWEAVQQGTDAMLNTLDPFQQSYVRNEIVKNQTPTERTWHNALSQKQQLDAIPAWIGISPEQAVRKQAAMTTLNQLLNLRTPGNAEKAAAFDRQNRALIHAGKPNPARIRFMLQPENADLRFWFGRASTKNQIANATLDPAELAPWEYSPTVTGPLVAPDLNAAPDLAEAGG